MTDRPVWEWVRLSRWWQYFFLYQWTPGVGFMATWNAYPGYASIRIWNVELGVWVGARVNLPLWYRTARFRSLIIVQPGVWMLGFYRQGRMAMEPIRWSVHLGPIELTHSVPALEGDATPVSGR